MQNAAGSSENLKPDLVMEAFCRFLGIEEDSCMFHYHRLEMYADTGKGGKRRLVTLEALGKDWETADEKKDSD